MTAEDTIIVRNRYHDQCCAVQYTTHGSTVTVAFESPLKGGGAKEARCTACTGVLTMFVVIWIHETQGRKHGSACWTHEMPGRKRGSGFGAMSRLENKIRS